MENIKADVLRDVVVDLVKHLIMINSTNFYEKRESQNKFCVLVKAVCLFISDFGYIEPDIVTKTDKDGIVTIRLNNHYSIIKVPFYKKYIVENFDETYVVYIGVYKVENKLVLGYFI